MTNATMYDKFTLLDQVQRSTLSGDNANLLGQLILRADKETWECFPSVERLAQARGIKHEKNFLGVDKYLPGLVRKEKRGRKNFYFLDPAAIMALPLFKVTIKHTPELEGVNTPATADNTPALADNTPAYGGANSSMNNTKSSSTESTLARDARESAKASSQAQDRKSSDKEKPIIPISSNNVGNPIDSINEVPPITLTLETPSPMVKTNTGGGGGAAAAAAGEKKVPAGVARLREEINSYREERNMPPRKRAIEEDDDLPDWYVNTPLPEKKEETTPAVGDTIIINGHKVTYTGELDW